MDQFYWKSALPDRRLSNNSISNCYMPSSLGNNTRGQTDRQTDRHTARNGKKNRPTSITPYKALLCTERLIMQEQRRPKCKTSALRNYKYYGCPIPTVDCEHALLQSPLFWEALKWSFRDASIGRKWNHREILTVFPRITPCWLVICCRLFVRVCCLHLQVVQEDSFDYREDGYVIA
jgi:hypothetical protein